MSTDGTQEPAEHLSSAPAITESSGTAPTTSTRPPMARSTRILAMTAGGVVAAAALFGGGVAFGTSLNGGSTDAAQQGQFGGIPPGGTGGGTGDRTGTAPNGTAPTGAPGGPDGTGGTTTIG